MTRAYGGASGAWPRRLAVLSLLLLLSPRQQADGQTPGLRMVSAAEYENLAAMEAACLEPSGQECLLSVTTHQRIAIAGDHAIPAGIRLRFEAGGSWEVSGGTLTVSSGAVEAAADHRIFADGSQIRGLEEARPEWFGDAGDGGYAAVALASAYRSTKPWGRILLRDTNYISPFFDPESVGSCGGSTLPYRSPRIFVGIRRPAVDDERDPTRLLGGTVIRGEICGGGAFGAYHLGVDEGPYVVSHLFGGHTSYGIMLARTEKLHQARGTVLEDVAVLTNGMHDQHSVLIEGQDEVRVQGLWLWSLGGTHGLVIKSAKSSVRDFHCRGASSDCLILKSDAATDGAGYAASVVVDGVDIRALKQAGDTGGIALDSRWDSVHDITLDHVTEVGTGSGIVGSGSVFHTLRNIRIQNWSADVVGACLILLFSQDVSVDGFHCRVSDASGPRWAMLLEGDRTALRDGRIECGADSRGCGGPMDGILDAATSTRLERIAGAGMTGYLVRDSSAGGETRLALSSSGGRVLSPPVGPTERMQILWWRWSSTLKGNLRILWTSVATRWEALPAWARGGSYAVCIGLVLLALLGWLRA